MNRSLTLALGLFGAAAVILVVDSFLGLEARLDAREGTEWVTVAQATDANRYREPARAILVPGNGSAEVRLHVENGRPWALEAPVEITVSAEGRVRTLATTRVAAAAFGEGDVAFSIRAADVGALANARSLPPGERAHLLSYGDVYAKVGASDFRFYVRFEVTE